jgi:hypothetical protein
MHLKSIQKGVCSLVCALQCSRVCVLEAIALNVCGPRDSNADINSKTENTTYCRRSEHSCLIISQDPNDHPQQLQSVHRILKDMFRMFAQLLDSHNEAKDTNFRLTL